VSDLSTAGETVGAALHVTRPAPEQHPQNPLSTKRILLVDDEDDVREVAQLSLEMVGGWQVSSAASGAEGLRRAASDHPDAILLDVMMPEMDGPATFRALQADPATRGIPVLLLTAKARPADRERFADLGVVGVLPKPFDPLTLPRDVSQALGWGA
jgi:two-component system alkaline phosphatase synthesis response regulator PhoP